MAAAIKQRVAASLFSSPDKLEPVTIKRRAMGSRNEFGEWVPGTLTQKKVSAATTPLNGDERETLPEGIRSRNVRNFWVKEQVRGVLEDETAGDIIVHEGLNFRAIIVEDWGEFRQVTAVEQDT